MVVELTRNEIHFRYRRRESDDVLCSTSCMYCRYLQLIDQQRKLCMHQIRKSTDRPTPSLRLAESINQRQPVVVANLHVIEHTFMTRQRWLSSIAIVSHALASSFRMQVSQVCCQASADNSFPITTYQTSCSVMDATVRPTSISSSLLLLQPIHLFALLTHLLTSRRVAVIKVCYNSSDRSSDFSRRTSKPTRQQTHRHVVLVVAVAAILNDKYTPSAHE